MNFFVSNLRVLAVTSLLLCPLASQAELYAEPSVTVSDKQYVSQDHANQGAWVMAFSNYTRQKAQDFTPGYYAKTFGGGFGVDFDPYDHLLVGVGMRFDYTDLDSTNYSGTNTNFTSTRFMAYARYEINERWFVNGLLGYSFNETNTQRFVYNFLGPAPQRASVIEAIGDLDARQWTVELNTGYQFSYDKWQLLPQLGFEYTHLANEDYAEKSAGMQNRRFADTNLDAYRFNLDIILAYQNEFPQAQLLPYIHFKAIYDTEAELVFTAEAFGGGTAFASFGPRPPHSSYQTGVGFTLFGKHKTLVSMCYDYTFKHHYRDHAGVVYIRKEW